MTKLTHGLTPMKLDDDRAGIAWWNALTETERAQWMAAAGNTGVAKDAWEAFKRAKPDDGD